MKQISQNYDLIMFYQNLRIRFIQILGSVKNSKEKLGTKKGVHKQRLLSHLCLKNFTLFILTWY